MAEQEKWLATVPAGRGAGVGAQTGPSADYSLSRDRDEHTGSPRVPTEWRIFRVYSHPRRDAARRAITSVAAHRATQIVHLGGAVR